MTSGPVGSGQRGQSGTRVSLTHSEFSEILLSLETVLTLAVFNRQYLIIYKSYNLMFNIKSYQYYKVFNMA